MEEKLNQSQSQQLQQQEQQKQEQQTVQSASPNVCANCKTENHPEARFCEECGNSLIPDHFCPNCGDKIHENGDICESCGFWLLEGKCKFCYAELEDGQQFCAECGNPAGGISCHNCGTLSNFDYCPKCFTPLTEAAAELLEQMKNNPEEREFLESRQAIVNLDQQIAQMEAELASDADEFKPVEEIVEIIEEPEELSPEPEEAEIEIDHAEKRRQKMELMANLLDEQLSNEAAEKQRQEALRRQKEAERKKAEAKALQEKKRAATERKKAEAEKRRKLQQQKVETQKIQQIEKQKKLEALKEQKKAEARKLTEQYKNMKHKRFTNNQMARNYFMAHRPPKYVGWVCNFQKGEILHPDPHNCADPWQGGVWVFEWDGITDANEIEWEKGTGL